MNVQNVSDIEKQKAIIKLCIYDLFAAIDQNLPHDVKIEQTAEKIIEYLDNENIRK